MSSKQTEHSSFSLPTLISKVIVDNSTYVVTTEEVSRKKTKVHSRVFLDGKIVSSEEADYSSIAEKRDFVKHIEEFMNRLHKKVIDEFTTESKKQQQKKKNEYFNESMEMIRAGKGLDALTTLRIGLVQYPSDPLLMSYCGCLYSIVAKKHKEGIKMCRDAINKLGSSVSLDKDVYFPSFYLNLGRAYLAAGKKKDAVKAFNLGLKSDPKDQEITKELKKLGSRRKQPVPFLKRSNPINKYVGLLLYKSAGKK